MRSSRSRAPCATLALALLLSSSARAADFYVDPAAGSDAHDGSSPALAWRTTTHALAALGTSSDTLHLLPGVYSAASGETFPWQAHGQRLVGDEGPELTIVDGGGGTEFLLWINSYVTGAAACPEVRGLRFTGATSGILVRSTWPTVTTRIEDVAIDACGIGIDIAAGGSFGAASFDVTAVSCDVRGCVYGIAVASSLSGHSSLLVEDCAIADCSADGLIIASGSNGGGVGGTLRRCSLTGHGQRGVHFTAAQGGIDLALEDCLIAHCAAEGFRAEEAQGATGTHFVRCTIAHDGAAGVYSRTDGSIFSHRVWLQGSLVFGNAADVDSNAVQSTQDSLIGVDPLFVDEPAGDFRLRFGSPAIDAGDASAPLGTLDLVGRARPIDGDLDTFERADAGCIEFTPLRVITSAHPGSPVRFEVAGPAGSAFTLYYTRGPRVPPQATTFGELELNTLTLGPLLGGTASRFPPFALQRPIPNSPTVIGRTFSFQALVASPLSPSGFAYTNSEQFKVTP